VAANECPTAPGDEQGSLFRQQQPRRNANVTATGRGQGRARYRVPGAAGFERLPVEPFAAALIFCLCMQSLGAVVVLAELALLGAILAIRWRELPRAGLVALPLLALPLFAVASAAWSAQPEASLRYGVQLALTAVMGIALVRFIDRRRLPLVVLAGAAPAMLIGLLSGNTGPSPEGPVLIGFAGSKNQMSYICLFWIAAALCVAASSQRHWLARIAAVLSLVPAVLLLVQGDSMTALVSAVVLAALLVGLGIAARLGPFLRLFALLSGGLLALTAVAALPQIEREAETFRADVLGKDRRLTGRTLLWAAADRLIEQRPVVGHGYKAIWMGREGEGLLARNDQKDGRSFHFHDTVREIRVDLGLVGLALFLLPLIAALVRAVPLLIERIDPGRAFAASALVLLLLRSRTELILGPFLIDTVILFAVIALFLTARREPERVPRPRESLTARHSRRPRPATT
jgi:exopolysaccharide production protein ExoQ